MPNSDPQPDPSTPQVLLFGHSGSGKSSLLAALVRAGEVQGETLRGDVQESTGRLSAIRDAVYHGTKIASTDTELTSYAIRIRPWRVDSLAVGESGSFILHDCSGKAAESLIRHPSSLRDPDTRAPIARAVIEADAILLLVDSTSNDDELQEAFEEFDTFLTVVAQGKASAREVGGYPILLVLTKCDELAHPGDSRAKWESHVNDRAERAWKQFDLFLKDADPDDGIASPFLPFGSIDLSVYAVAIRLPPFLDSPRSDETPFQVAELFRDSFAAARTHNRRATNSNRRLRWTVRAALALVTIMLVGALAVSLFPPQRGDPGLAERVQGYSEHEPIGAVRLSDANLPKNRRMLTAFRDDPAFIKLPVELREFVLARLHEIDEYQAYRLKVSTAYAPGDVRTLEDLERIERALQTGELALPTLAWEGTSADQLREKWLADVRAIRETERVLLERYQDYSRRGTALALTNSFGGAWRADVGSLVAEAANPPVTLTDPLPNSPELEQPRGKAVAYRVPFEFQRVYEARRDWNFAQDRLLRLRELADAVALTEGAENPEPALVLPEPGRGVNSSTLPGSRLFALRNFPSEAEAFRDWELSNFPDPGRSILTDRLNRSFSTGSRHVHKLLVERIGSDPESKDNPAGSRAVADALIDPAFADWGRLLHFMLRLRDSSAKNPVTELAEFLRATRFELDFRGFDLVIPPDLGLEKVSPSGSLTITVVSKDGSVAQQFKQSGAGIREGTSTSYQFVPDPALKLTYRPGDELRIEIPVRSGTQEHKLVWESSNSKTYQFERLNREPRLVKATGTEAATGVKLTTNPASALPKLPALFPDLKK